MQDIRSDDNHVIVILGIDEETALNYGRRIRRISSWKILPLFQRAELYLLYGHRNLPFDVVPGTPVLPWHSQIQPHITAGRLIPVRQHVKKQSDV